MGTLGSTPGKGRTEMGVGGRRPPPCPLSHGGVRLQLLKTMERGLVDWYEDLRAQDSGSE